MFLLDTNVVSELRKAPSGKANGNVARWASSIPASAMYISAITLLELETGVLLVLNRDDRQGILLKTWLENHVLTAFSGRILPVDIAVARCCAQLHVPDRRPERDALIAATAITHGMTVVTRNLEDFDSLGVSIYNPWTQA